MLFDFRKGVSSTTRMIRCGTSGHYVPAHRFLNLSGWRDSESTSRPGDALVLPYLRTIRRVVIIRCTDARHALKHAPRRNSETPSRVEPRLQDRTKFRHLASNLYVCMYVCMWWLTCFPGLVKPNPKMYVCMYVCG